jgi:hypothetical protein
MNGIDFAVGRGDMLLPGLTWKGGSTQRLGKGSEVPVGSVKYLVGCSR